MRRGSGRARLFSRAVQSAEKLDSGVGKGRTLVVPNQRWAATASATEVRSSGLNCAAGVMVRKWYEICLGLGHGARRRHSLPVRLADANYKLASARRQGAAAAPERRTSGAKARYLPNGLAARPRSCPSLSAQSRVFPRPVKPCPPGPYAQPAPDAFESRLSVVMLRRLFHGLNKTPAMAAIQTLLAHV
jgi:hypothetical protein